MKIPYIYPFQIDETRINTGLERYSRYLRFSRIPVGTPPALDRKIMSKRDPLLDFRNTLELALYRAERNPDLIRVRPLLRRALNIVDEKLRERRRDG